jgi:dTDP-4-amino-4,6-dideoxygalactose transaminase
LQVARFDPQPCGFPRPAISHLPDRLELAIPSAGPNRGQVTEPRPGRFRDFSRGRYALGQAYEIAGVGSEGALLAPAYHCITMLDPAVALGAEIVLYPVLADLSPDLEQLENALASLRTPAKALLATHFFGRIQDFAQLRQWCDQREIALIEDCSHVLYCRQFQAEGAGRYGHFVAASPYKFFPSADGGLLYSTDGRVQRVEAKSAPLAAELRGIKHTLEKRRAPRLPAADFADIDRQLDTLGASPVTTADELVTDYDHPSQLYSPLLKHTAALRSSGVVVRLSSPAEIARRRRENYRLWADGVSGLPNCTRLYPTFPENDVPYMFPLLISHPMPHFYWLKHLGVPLWRWDEMAFSEHTECAVARHARLHLIHLPCHQSLARAQIDWMIAALAKTLRRPVHQEC